METVAHREPRNHSAEVLRRVQSGESFEVTNDGHIVAILTPPVAAPFAVCSFAPLSRGDFSSLLRVSSPRIVQATSSGW
jgi:Antitoxin of toxin-antitoxin stability system